jgi:hypothetical protein
MSIHCANCGRVVPKQHPQDGNLHFCDYACWGLYEGAALEDELSDLEEQWEDERNEAE